jgi:hypothetical protein
MELLHVKVDSLAQKMDQRFEQADKKMDLNESTSRIPHPDLADLVFDYQHSGIDQRVHAVYQYKRTFHAVHGLADQGDRSGPQRIVGVKGETPCGTSA